MVAETEPTEPTGPTPEGEPWRFGEDPLAQTERLAAAVRRLSDLALRVEQPSTVVDDITARIEAAVEQLGEEVPASMAPRVGASVDGDGRVYIDHSRDIGRFNAVFPHYTLEVDGDVARGVANVPPLYEGPPGVVHGGFVGVLVDAAVQEHNCAVGVAGRTAGMEIRYRAATPVGVDLELRLRRRVEGRWIHSEVEILAGDFVCATGQVRSVVGVRDDLPPVSPRRAEPMSSDESGGST